jgi:4'-phosphopantetheinyl transferase
VRPISDAERIAATFFHPLEYTSLMNAPDEVRMEVFFTLWTKKEAYLKALGTGLSVPLDSFSVSTAPDGTP